MNFQTTATWINDAGGAGGGSGEAPSSPRGSSDVPSTSWREGVHPAYRDDPPDFRGGTPEAAAPFTLARLPSYEERYLSGEVESSLAPSVFLRGTPLTAIEDGSPVYGAFLRALVSVEGQSWQSEWYTDVEAAYLHSAVRASPMYSRLHNRLSIPGYRVRLDDRNRQPYALVVLVDSLNKHLSWKLQEARTRKPDVRKTWRADLVSSLRETLVDVRVDNPEYWEADIVFPLVWVRSVDSRTMRAMYRLVTTSESQHATLPDNLKLRVVLPAADTPRRVTAREAVAAGLTVLAVRNGDLSRWTDIQGSDLMSLTWLCQYLVDKRLGFAPVCPSGLTADAYVRLLDQCLESYITPSRSADRVSLDRRRGGSIRRSVHRSRRE
jgi:hypothetical protein